MASFFSSRLIALASALALSAALTPTASAAPGQSSKASAASKDSKNQNQEKAEEEKEPKPWEEGVSAEDQAKARGLFKEGTALLNDAAFAPAAGKLEEALSLWGHPAIHYNMAMAQVQLDRPLEARKHLVAATAFGADALGEQNFESAKTYIRLVEKQLTMAKISAELDGVEVSLDGKPLFSSPNSFSDFLPPGKHAIVARKEGYLTSELSETFEPGVEKELSIKLYTAEELTEYRRRWPVWMPWTVLGSGAALVTLGGILHGVGYSKLSDFDRHAKKNGLLGVPTTDRERDLRTSGIRMEKAGVSFYVLGGAAIAAGVTFLVLNKATPYLFGKPVEENSETSNGSLATPASSAPASDSAPQPSVAIAPMFLERGAGVSASATF